MVIQLGMKWRILLAIVTSLLSWNFSASAMEQARTRFQPPQFKTQWADNVSATNAHPEYPRPTMVRDAWLNLNGLWDCAFTRLGQTNSVSYTNKILVPFPVESQ